MDRFDRFPIRMGLVFTVVVLQIVVDRLNWILNQQISLLDFGVEAFSYSLLVVGLGVLSGILLSLSMMQSRHTTAEGKNLVLYGVAIGIVPALVIGYKLVFGLTAAGIPPLRSPLFKLWEWAVFSQIPPFWLGIVIGRVMEHKLYLKPERDS